MGNKCCKPAVKKPPSDVEKLPTVVEGPLDRTQSIFVKSKVEKFKKNNEPDFNLESAHMSTKRQVLNLHVASDSDSDLEPKLESAENSQNQDYQHSRHSASRNSQISKSG